MKILDLIRELSAYAVSEGNVEVMISLCDLDNHYRYGRIECDSVLLNGNVCLDCEEVKPYDYEEQETDSL